MNLPARIIQTAASSAHQLKQQVQEAASLIEQHQKKRQSQHRSRQKQERQQPEQKERGRRFSDGGASATLPLRPTDSDDDDDNDSGTGELVWRARVGQQPAAGSPELRDMSFPTAAAAAAASQALASGGPSRHQAAADAPTATSAAPASANASAEGSQAAADQQQPSVSPPSLSSAAGDIAASFAVASAGTASSVAATAVAQQSAGQAHQHNQAQDNHQQLHLQRKHHHFQLQLQPVQPSSQLTTATLAAPAPVSPSPSPSPSVTNASSSSVANPDTRTHVVGELYDTERSYVESLQILVEKYMKPLKSLESNRVLIDLNLVDEIFYTIPELLQHHETFLSALQDRLSSDWDTSQVIGNVFIEAFTNQQIIDTYTAFINNWKNAKHAIKVATQAKPAFEKFLEAMSREHRNKLTLDALLIMPVQRIPRYELLIKELIKHTPEDHPDYGPLIEAQKQIHELALKIDRAEREMIHQEQLRDLESLIDGHAELQHPQRDFIRYDLVTILGASALTVAKKERVLFLFCDLLIMTSIKKKVSRRSNLQSAFANSINDLSLLEGNKFKLLLRVSLDQVEIHLANDQIQLHQQQQEQQSHQLHLQQQTKLIQDRKREIEADLHILHQMESLCSQFSFVDKNQINGPINELTSHLRQRLFSLDQLADSAQSNISDMQQLQMALDSSSRANTQSHSSAPTTATATPSTIIQSPPQANNPPTTHQSTVLSLSSSLLPSNTPLNSSLTNNHHNHHHHHHHHHSQDSNASLELIISNNSSSNSNKDANISSYSVANANESANDQALHGIGGKSTDSSSSGQAAGHHHAQHTTNSDTLVVTFASIDRRQAFLQAFIEAKQHRYQLLQQQQHCRTFSSSLTVKLAHSPDRHTFVSQDPRRSKLQHQENIEGRSYLSGANSNFSPLRHNNKSFINLTQQQQPQAHQMANATTARITSAPLGQRYGSTIVHQMSAPQSLALVAASGGCSPLGATSERSFSQCTSCSANLISGDQENQRQHYHPQTHHHQLIHQPASNPASLDTICWREQHKDDHGDQSTKLGQLDEFMDSVRGEQYHYQDCCPQDKHLQLMSLNIDIENSNNLSHMNQSGQQINQAMFFQFAPKFITSLPMNFLSTQHPALQFTCSTPCQEQKRQTVKDKSGQLWLCMSNGYVSHIALISLRQRRPKRNTQADLGGPQTNLCDDSLLAGANFQIVPIIKSAGDICKSHINCAAQVRWTKRKKPVNSEISESMKEVPPKEKSESVTKNSNDPQQDEDQEKVSSVEVAIDTASPPVDIILRPNLGSAQTEAVQERLSESAPSHGDKSTIHEISNRLTKLPASTSRLELPPHGPRRAVSQPRSSRCTADSIAIHNQASSSSYDRKRAAHDAICQRHHRHDSRLLHGRLSSSASGQQQSQRHHFSSQHHQHNRGNNFEQGAANNSCRSSHIHHHSHQHHYHHHHVNHQHHVHHLYHTRHNTVPLAELRRALERQNKISDLDFHPAGGGGHCRGRNYNLAPPTNTPADSAIISPGHQQQQQQQQSVGSDSIDSAELPATAAGSHHNLGPKKPAIRASTPPACYSGNKSLRSARLLRHQASLKTSSILAKLVGGTRRTSRKAERDKQQQKSDVEENDTDTENGKSHQAQQQQSTTNMSQTTDDSSSLDSNIVALTTSTSTTTNKCSMANTLMISELNNPIVSPLSSASSLTSTNSSIAENSFCTHSPNRSASDLVFHSYPTSCCEWPSHSTFGPISCNANNCSELAAPARDCGSRSRSATVPNRKSLQIDGELRLSSPDTCAQHQAKNSAEIRQSGDSKDSSYKISEIVGDLLDKDESNATRIDEEGLSDAGSSLWLGCDDGSLIIIDCLVKYSDSDNNCDYCNPNQRNLNCGNVHSEIKLGAPVCDICTHKDEMVFVALANGQLAIISRKEGKDDTDSSDTAWTLTNPKLLTITANELNSTSKLCLINDNHLWYSYGRNIFILNVSTLELETTVMAPSNDLSLQLTMQPVIIDYMEPMASIDGVWITFKNSHLIQLYNVKSYKLLIEINLFEPINKMLYFGNEILMHHKTACLKATSLLSVNNERERCNTLFIGTSAGIVLYLNITHKQLERKELSADGTADCSPLTGNWVPQVACLRHGHSGQVRLLHIIEIEEDQDRQIGAQSEFGNNYNGSNSNSNNNDNLDTSEEKELYLISGGAGVDLYGPSDEQQDTQLSNDVDSFNHLLLWKL